MMGKHSSDYFIKTPCLLSSDASELVGQEVYFKLENLQPTGSFKIRGISNAILKARNAKSLVSSSGGNAGLSTLYMGSKLGLPTTVVVPETTPTNVLSMLRNKGANVMVHGRSWNEAHEFATKFSNETEAFLVHPYDHSDIWEGHSTIVDELYEQLPSPPSKIVVAVGGGGLLLGVLLGLKKYPEWAKNICVVAMETEGANCFNLSTQSGDIVTISDITSIAITLGARSPAPALKQYLRSPVISSYTVSDQDAVSALLKYADQERCLVEPSCGAALSYVYSMNMANARGTGIGPIVVVVCGGAAATLDMVLEWKLAVGL